MLPPRCTIPPCMNIALKSVTAVAGWLPRTRTPSCPSQSTAPAGVRPQCLPGWVSS